MVEESVWEIVKRELPADWLADEPTSEEIHLGAKQTRYGKAAGAEGFLAEFSKYRVKQSSAGRNPGFSQNHVEQGSRRKPRPRGNGVAGQLVSGHPFSKIKVVDMTKTNTVESLCFVSDLSCWQG